jgi:hypothetical protein
MTDRLISEFPFLLLLGPTSVSAEIDRLVYCDLAMDFEIVFDNSIRGLVTLSLMTECLSCVTDIKFEDEPTLILRALILIATTIVFYSLYVWYQLF